MDETQFNALAEATLSQLESALDRLNETLDVDLDIELKPGGIIELAFENGARIVVNRHTAAREIWVAAKSGGFHFRPEGERWCNTRDGSDLFESLSALMGEQLGRSVTL